MLLQIRTESGEIIAQARSGCYASGVRDLAVAICRRHEYTPSSSLGVRSLQRQGANPQAGVILYALEHGYEFIVKKEN